MSNLPEFDASMIREAQDRVSKYTNKTPLIYSPGISRLTGAEVYLKMECWQTCGSFKIRGVTNFLLSKTKEELAGGVVTASSGNHGSALAYIANLTGVNPAKIFMPDGADPVKVQQIQMAGAEAVVGGENFFKAFDRAKEDQLLTGIAYVHSHADPLVIAGQGTIGLDILEDLPDADMIVVPIGGGGLISGVTAGARSISPDIRIVGAEPEAAPGAWLSLKEGRSVEKIDLKPSLADGLAGGLSPLPFSIAGHLIEEVALASENEILKAMKTLYREERIVAEGAASVGMAALLAGKIKAPDQKIVFVITGRNIDPQKFLALLAG